MPALLTTGSVLMCPHGGMVIASPSSGNLMAGTPVICQSDSYVIAGCAFNIAGAPSPCVSVNWIVPAARVRHAGSLVLTAASQGLCVNAAQAPQGPVVINAGQSTVNGQ